VGVVSLGGNRQRLLDLRLETKRDGSLSRRICHDGRLLYFQRSVDVAGEHRNHVRRLVVVTAGILSAQKQKTGNRLGDFRFLNLQAESAFFRQRRRPRINCIPAKQLFDAQQLIVFCSAIRAAQRTRFNLAAVGRDGDIGDG
jgi:hypothetical protein